MSPLSDADLHGLVDGHLEPTRRIDVLKRLALSSVDRIRVEAWQQQTDLLRNAFIGIENETLPANLDLNPKPRLRCVSVLDAPMPATSLSSPAKQGGAAPAWIKGASFFVIALGVVVFFGATYSGARQGAASVASQEPVIDILLQRAAKAAAIALPGTDRLPTVTIPDLAPAGFKLVGMNAEKEPASLQMLYRNDASERLVISVARTVETPVTKPQRVGDAYIWRTRANAFAMTGSIDSERLRAIAAALQADDIQ